MLPVFSSRAIGEINYAPRSKASVGYRLGFCYHENKEGECFKIIISFDELYRDGQVHSIKIENQTNEMFQPYIVTSPIFFLLGVNIEYKYIIHWYHVVPFWKILD